MLRKWIAGALGLFTVGNGVFMLVAARQWYDTVPGVHDTGPFNRHFVADIGAAFLVAGLGLFARAWRVRYWPAALAGAAFLGAHGLIHVTGLIGGQSHHASFEWISVVAPSALALWVSLPTKGENDA